MQLTTLRLTNPIPLRGIGPGTGKYNKEEIYPCTKTLLNKLGISGLDTQEIFKKQNKTLNTLPNYESINNLREYQIEDVKFLAARKNAACFNEQRTGKTPTALTTMKVKNVDKLLIVAPASTLYTWAKECKKWWFEDLPVIVCDGTAAKRKKIIKEWRIGALIISYECLRETTRIKTSKDEAYTTVEITGDIGTIKQHKDIAGIILDEAHRIKNHKSKQAIALFSLDYIPNKLALTGTPAPGKQHEIYSILHWLYPTLFSGYWRFIDYYFEKMEQYTSTNSFSVIGTFKHNKEIELQEFLNAISTRRLRASVMAWLPEKDRQIISLPQSKEQIKYIKELNKTFEIEGTDINVVNVLAKLIKIRQILLGPEVLGLKGKSPKVNWIKQYIKDYPEKNIIIFSNFTEWLKLLGKELECDNFIIGETTKANREKLKNDFQEGKTKLLLINIKAGKEGITLDNADVIIFTDKYPPVGDILQAEDRFVATTKDKMNKEHTIIDLVMENSYEENILKLLASNANEVDIVNNYIEYLKGEEYE